MKKLKVEHSTRYKKDLKRVVRRGYNLDLLDEVVEMLEEGKALSPKYQDHALKGKWKTFRECHITPDWLLIYKIKHDVLILVLQSTGTHSDLF